MPEVSSEGTLLLAGDTYVAANPATGDRARIVATLPLAPAGHVKTPGVDDVLERLEASIDAVEYQQRFFEGEKLDGREVERKRQLYQLVAREVNKRLAGRVTLTGGYPESKGLGARFLGTDSDGREYVVDWRFDDEARMANERDDMERGVREMVDMLTHAILEKREEYLSRMVG